MPLNLLSMRIFGNLTQLLWPVARRNKHGNTRTPKSQALGRTTPTTTPLPPISRLPSELIDMITLYLPASSAVAFRRCNKQLYINGGPEPPGLLYSSLCNGEDKDDHLLLLCLLERDAAQRLACSICIAMHEKKFFNTAEISKPSAERKCRTVKICPHCSLTFPQLQRIISTYSTHHGNLQYELFDCSIANCLNKPSKVYFDREVKVEYELCLTRWPFGRVWRKKLYLFTSWVIYSEEYICPQRSEGSSLWSWRLCPHFMMKDCCDCCRVDDPGRVQLEFTWGKDDRDTMGRVMQCKLCCTKISSSEFGRLRVGPVGRVIRVKRYLGQGTSVEDEGWIRQTTPDDARGHTLQIAAEQQRAS